MSEWRPIETAPKDGAEILVLFGERPDVEIAQWSDSAAIERLPDTSANP
jgi:hypothetical protein